MVVETQTILVSRLHPATVGVMVCLDCEEALVP